MVELTCCDKKNSENTIYIHIYNYIFCLFVYLFFYHKIRFFYGLGPYLHDVYASIQAFFGKKTLHQKWRRALHKEQRSKFLGVIFVFSMEFCTSMHTTLINFTKNMISLGALR